MDEDGEGAGAGAGAGADESRRLRADDSMGASLAERLAQRLHRLSWRTPIHKMRLNGRYPLQLLDVPGDPIPGDPAAGKALIEGRMMHGGETVPLAALDRGGFSAAFGDHLQSFGWLRDLAAAASRPTGAPVAEALMRRWLTAHARTVDAAWRADLWGQRILAWTAYAPFLLDSRDADYRKQMLNALARGARHLDRAADSAGQGLPRITAWAGVLAAGLLIPGGDIRAAQGEAGIAKALAQAVRADGGLSSRSPVEQLRLIELLAQMRAVYEVRARPPSGAVAAALGQTVPALLAVVLGDGALSSWQGGGPVTAARVRAAIAAVGAGAGAGASAAAGGRPDPIRGARDWGYQHLAQGESRVVIDVGPPPVGTLAVGGCASTLAFELSDGAQRIVVNCGGGPGLPRPLAEGLRTTAAHSTLTLADINSTAIHADGTLGKGVGEVDVVRSEIATGVRIEASHDGYVKRLGFRHHRRLLLASDGRALSGEDRLEPAGRRKPGGTTPLVIRFHLAPGIEVATTADDRGALLRTPAGTAWSLRAAEGIVAIEDSVWIDAAGRARPTRQMVIGAEAPPAGIVIGWTLRRVS